MPTEDDSVGTGDASIISVRDERGSPIANYICKANIRHPQVGDFIRVHMKEQPFTAEVLRRTFDYEVSGIPRHLLVILTCGELTLLPQSA